MSGTAIELTALNFVSNAPVTGKFVIGSVLVTAENAEQFYYPDSPFWRATGQGRSRRSALPPSVGDTTTGAMRKKQSPVWMAIASTSRSRHARGMGLMRYLGLDLVASGLKSILIDASQKVVAEAHAALSVARPKFR